MRPTVSYFYGFVVWIGLLLFACPMQAQHGDMLSRKIYLSGMKGSIYELLEKVTQQSGVLFIYDSRIINNEKQVRTKSGERTVREAIYEITQNRNLSLRSVGNHILIQLAPKEASVPAEQTVPLSAPYAVIEGFLVDQQTQEPISFGTVGVHGTSIGTITNQNGEFRLHVPDSLIHSSLQFSHVGYLPQQVAISLVRGHHTTFSLEPKNISIQEVVVRLVNPQRIIKDMLDKRKENYASFPVYFTSFYREGIEKKKDLSIYRKLFLRFIKLLFILPRLIR
ncbi:MAG: carboxypeptidase-like regulatory domain-containing protein [Tannerellaceae bacterium]|nr:carboxypeptidase-like regulatory domain-containing protein [Tannerellaceae bacterium]